MSGTVRFLDQKQVERLLQVPNTRTATGLRNACILRLLWETGLRIDECLSLKLEDIDIEARTVVVRRGKRAKTRMVG
jgi:integrase/recombinase XerD